MIKFFRNIRQKLLEQGKTANYFKYAIGEIVLCPVRDKTWVAIKIGSYPRAVRYGILYYVPKGTKTF